MPFGHANFYKAILYYFPAAVKLITINALFNAFFSKKQ